MRSFVSSSTPKIIQYRIFVPGVSFLSDHIQEFLSASFHEQLPVTIYFGSHRLSGTVTDMKDDAVEIRHEKSRSVILMRKIYAVSRE